MFALLSLGMLLILSCEPAYAHLASTRFGEFYSGLLHPWLSLEFMLSWAAIALLAGMQGIHCSRRLVIYFPAAVIVGVAISQWFGQPPWLDSAFLAAIALTGLLLAWSPSMPVNSLSLLLAISGVFFGMGNGAAELSGGALLLYICGVGVAAYLSVLLLSAATLSLTQCYMPARIVTRAIGGWIAAVGLLISGLSVQQIPLS